MFVVRTNAMAFHEVMSQISPSVELTNALCAAVLNLFMLVGGYMIPTPSIPIGWKWLHYVSIFKYPFMFFASQQLRGLELTCSPGKGQIPCPNNPAEKCCVYNTGEEVLSVFGVDADHIYFYMGMVLGFYVFLKIVSFLSLKYINWIKR